VLTTTFRPTECLMAPALCLPRAALCSGTPARDLGPLRDTPRRRTGVLFWPRLLRWSIGATNGGAPSKTSTRRGTAPGTPIARQQSVRCPRSNHAHPLLHTPHANRPLPRWACNRCDMPSGRCDDRPLLLRPMPMTGLRDCRRSLRLPSRSRRRAYDRRRGCCVGA
jgi:hypothetical protein